MADKNLARLQHMLVHSQESFYNLVDSDFGVRGSAEIDANFEHVSEIERDAFAPQR